MFGGNKEMMFYTMVKRKKVLRSQKDNMLPYLFFIVTAQYHLSIYFFQLLMFSSIDCLHFFFDNIFI